jgi:membrane associated rhomboid family serine protease
MRTVEEGTELTPTTAKHEMTQIKRELVWQAKVVGSMGAVLWLLELIDTFALHQALNAYGVVPRVLGGLIGVLTAPFLHGDLAHLASNTFPLMLFSWLIMMRDNREWGASTAIIMLVSGLGTWLIAASNSVHIGASGLVFGYFGYLLSMGIFERKLGSILLSLIIGLFYGSLAFGMIPFLVPGFISWQMHLFGFVGGIFAAWFINRRTRGGKRRLLEGGI